MSNQPKNEGARRRDEETRLSAGHLAGGVSAPAKSEDDDEDWADMPKSDKGTKTAPTKTSDEDLEKELEDEDLNQNEDEDEDEDEDEEANLTNTPAAASPQQTPKLDQFDLTAELLSIERLQNNLPALLKALDHQVEGISEKRRLLDEEEKSLKTRINFVRVLSGQAPLTESKSKDDDEDEPSAPRRRGGRRRRASTDDNDDDKGDESKGEGDADSKPASGRGGRGKREKNTQTLKEAIMRSLFTMTHPTSKDPQMMEHTGFVNDITKKVTKEQGYKTTSEKPTNTVRIQMYRLEEDKMVKQNDDGSYTLRKRAIEWVRQNGVTVPKEDDSDD